MKFMIRIIAFMLTFAKVGAIEFCPKGRVDGGAAFFRVKTLEDGNVTEKLDMWGGRLDATLLFIKDSGLCLKPFGFGANGDGNLWGAGVGVGHYTPIHDKVTLIPIIGYSHTDLSTNVDLILPFIKIPNVHERFSSNSFYTGIEICFNPCSYLNFTGIYQYAWAKTKTFLTHTSFKSTIHGKSQGSSYAAVADYYFDERFSLTAAFGYNLSLNEENFGIEGYGIKLGLAYCFY